MIITNLLSTGGASLARTEEIIDDLGRAEGVYINPCPYIKFESPDQLTLEVIPTTIGGSSKIWDGTVEYCLSDPDEESNWNEWNGLIITSTINKIFLRGINNTIFNTHNTIGYGFRLGGSNINCMGNIENLLDYNIVSVGGHPTMGDSCFSCLFSGNRNLTSVQITLPAITLTRNCYGNMFSGTGINISPDLPATELADSCYSYMFSDCTNLTTAPALPALDLYNIHGCYQGMFSGCTSLVQAPALPATTLSQNCYQGMFSRCVNLETLPSLPALEITYYSYYKMFFGCVKIKLATESSGEYITPYRIPITGNGSVSAYGLSSMFSETGGTFTGQPDINTTYYTSNTVINPN